MQNSPRFAENPLLYSLFRFPKSSTTTLVNVMAEKNKGELISVEEARLTIKGRSSFRRNVLDAAEGATIIAYESAVHLSGVSFQSNEYRTGSAFSLHQGSNGTLDGVRFLDNTIDSGSCVSVTNVAELQIHASAFEENKVTDGPVIFVNGKCDERDPLLNISSTRFSKNKGGDFSLTALRVGIQLLIAGFDGGRVLLHSTTFSLNGIGWDADRISLSSIRTFSGSGSFLMTSSEHVDFAMTDCTFFANRVMQSLSEMYFDQCNGDFLISKSRFSSNIGVGKGRVIYFHDSAGERSNLSIADSVFQNNCGDLNNIHIDGAKSVRVERSNFTENCAHLEGFALFVDNADSFEAHDCQILDNIILFDRLYGPMLLLSARSGAFVLHSVRTVVLKGSVFYNNTGFVGSAVRYEPRSDKTKMLVEFCTFQKNIGVNGVFYLLRGREVKVQNSSFIENISFEKTGTVHLEDTYVMRVQSCTFQKNEAETGGGLSVGGYHTAEISSSAFHRNKAHSFGGAVCINNGKSKSHGAKIRNTTFTENTAFIGGAMSSSETNSFHLHECSFVRNSATLYGGAVALLKMPGWTTYLPWHKLGFLSFAENSAAYGG